MIPAIDPTKCDHQGAPEGRCTHCCECSTCQAERDMDSLSEETQISS